MSDLRAGAEYQLQFSTNFSTWEDFGEPFTATSTTDDSYQEVGDSLRYWRVKLAQPSGSEPRPWLSSNRAVRLTFANLTPGADYQLQVSDDMIAWTDHGPVVRATAATMVYPEGVDVANWYEVYFQLKPSP
jgi:hypothetical protein